MRYKPGQKEETRQRMLEAASRGFRSQGYAGIGVDGLAKAAGVTSGAFYAHFGSKDAAFEAALVLGLDEVIEGIPAFQREHGAGWIEAFADYYLGKAHRDDHACGCAMTALTPEVVRGSREMQTLYEEKMIKIAKLMARGLRGGSEQDRLARAWSTLSVLIGGLTVSRAMPGTNTSERIAEAIKAAAIQAAGRTQES
ncbi:TetR/AcrR family transcriptional regulator [Pelagibius sp. Alg239-R121]|uniref:TetR/AcrR family transcriptional regulator n=1 Tax=Pelagibius sp. Alg239-R121 TaxID=2993448 RepID=UPI0024A6DE6D|nr:TetR/AcrR family transcriptional regulator [Pelagibius sp. Alg239-R121]